MKKRFSIFLLLLICVMPILVACNEAPTTYSVTFMTPKTISVISGEMYINPKAYQPKSTITVEAGKYIGDQAPDATYGTGRLYAFVGWYTEKECINSWNTYKDAVNCDITLYAKYVKV